MPVDVTSTATGVVRMMPIFEVVVLLNKSHGWASGTAGWRAIHLQLVGHPKLILRIDNRTTEPGVMVLRDRVSEELSSHIDFTLASPQQSANFLIWTTFFQETEKEGKASPWQ